MRYDLRDDLDNEFGYALFRVDDDGSETYLGTDVMEPEDVRFTRDLAWVPDELNALAHMVELASMRCRDLEDQNKNLVAEAATREDVCLDVAARLEKCANTVATNFPGVKNKLLLQARRLRGESSPWLKSNLPCIPKQAERKRDG